MMPDRDASNVTSSTRERLRALLTEGLDRADVLILLMGYADGMIDAEIAQVVGQDAAGIARRREATIRRIREELQDATEAQRTRRAT